MFDGEMAPVPFYDQFPRGADEGFGPDQGYNTFVQINDPELFTPEARERPEIRALLEAPFSLTFVMLKSSHREAEYYLHLPHEAMAGRVPGIVGRVSGFPEAGPRIGTYVINHDATLAKSIMYAMVIENGAQAGQMIYKHPEPDGTQA